MTISVGDRLPAAELLEKTDAGIAPVSLQALTAGRKVVLFSLPGAFTGVCSTQHLPSFIRVADRLREKGVAEIACIAVNDPHVMMAWGETAGAQAAGVRMLADPASVLTKAMDMQFSNPGAGMFDRSRRSAMLVDDGVVTILNLEESPGQCDISGGETMLDAL